MGLLHLPCQIAFSAYLMRPLVAAEMRTADGSIMSLLHLSCQIAFSAFLKTYRGERESHKAVLLMAS